MHNNMSGKVLGNRVSLLWDPSPCWDAVGWLGGRITETFLRDPSISQLSLLFWLIFFPSQETLNLGPRMENLCPLTNHISFQIHFLMSWVLPCTLLGESLLKSESPKIYFGFPLHHPSPEIINYNDWISSRANIIRKC